MGKVQGFTVSVGGRWSVGYMVKIVILKGKWRSISFVCYQVFSNAKGWGYVSSYGFEGMFGSQYF